MGEKEDYEAAKEGMNDRARYKLANLAAHNYEATPIKGALLKRKDGVLLVTTEGETYRLSKCV